MSEPLDDLDPLDHEAHRWVTLLVSGEANSADARALQHWRKQSTDHEQAFLRARHRWRDYRHAGERLKARGLLRKEIAPAGQVSRRIFLGGAAAAAASLAGYAAIRPPLHLWPSLGELAADYRTGIGEQRKVLLANDVEINLNTRTSIAVPQGDSDNIKLISGEASFAMRPGAERPLNVVAGNGRSTATNGRFDVRNVDTQVCVTCVEGEVIVMQGRSSIALGHGQQARYDAAGLHEASAVDLDASTAWQDGTLVFRLTPLSEVVDEINRYRSGHVLLMDAGLAANPVNGRFQIARIDEVLVWIEQAFNMRRRSLPGGIVLLG